MTAKPMPTTATVIPALRYRDAHGAIEWLCANFGFQKHLVVPGDKGNIAHAQLSFGNGMIMLGSIEVESEYGKAVSQADGNPAPQALYVVVADADEVYRSAKAAGTLMVIDIKDEEYGGRGFTCRDLEGHIWSFGTYDPWKTQ
jgi:uncharacterized glyoxalase superfamily protein PhnB